MGFQIISHHTNGYFSDLENFYYSKGINRLEHGWTKCIILIRNSFYIGIDFSNHHNYFLFTIIQPTEKNRMVFFYSLDTYTSVILCAIYFGSEIFNTNLITYSFWCHSIICDGLPNMVLPIGIRRNDKYLPHRIKLPVLFTGFFYNFQCYIKNLLL